MEVAEKNKMEFRDTNTRRSTKMGNGKKPKKKKLRTQLILGIFLKTS